MIYLDNAATTKPRKEVIEAMMPYFTDKWYNPSALYGKASEIKKDIENARKTIGDFINADKDEIFFTSGGSESNCWAVQGFVNHCKRINRTPTVITSVIEHKSIIECIDDIDADVHYVGVDKDGFINIEALENLLKYVVGNKVLVSIQFSSNEIGTIQHIKEIADLVHKYDGVFHADAVQAFGQIPIDVKEFEIDMLSASGHKIGALKGIGILYKKKSVNISSLIYGTQMDDMRGGTENVPYIIGMAKAVELCNVNDIINFAAKKHIQYYLMECLKDEFGCTINGNLENRLPNNINVTFPQNITGEALIYLLDMCEIYISSGAACNSHTQEPSHVLKAIGLTDEECSRTVRITLPEIDSVDEWIAKVDMVVSEIGKQIKLLSV